MMPGSASPAHDAANAASVARSNLRCAARLGSAARRAPWHVRVTRSICFLDSVADDADATPAVAAERDMRLAQPYLLGQAFRSLGLEVTIIAGRDSVPSGCSAEGLRVIECETAGVARRRDVERSGALQRALLAADADLYFEFCDLDGPTVVSRFCRSRRRRHLVRLGAGIIADRPRRSAPVAWLAQSRSNRAVRLADLVSVASVQMERAVQDTFDVSAAVVGSAVAMPAARQDDLRDVDVLRFGAVDASICSELAMLLPRGDIIGRCVGIDSERPDVAVSLHGADAGAPISAAIGASLASWLSRSRLLLCDRDSLDTPEMLQLAWSHGVPVIAAADPDGIIEQHRLGLLVAKRRDFGRAIAELIGDRPRLLELSEHCRQFASQQLSAAAVAARYAALFGFYAAKYSQPL